MTRTIDDLGPVRDCYWQDEPGRIYVDLDPDGGVQAHSLDAWTQYMTVYHHTLGRYDNRDQYRRLSLQGIRVDGIPIVVVATWPVDSPQVRMMTDIIETYPVNNLIQELVQYEPERG